MMHVPMKRKVSASKLYARNVRQLRPIVRVQVIDIDVTLPSTQDFLSHLPEEVVLNVCSFLDTSALSSLSRTDRRNWRISSEVLYKAYTHDGDPQRSLLRTIVSNAQLASHVKEISWEYSVAPVIEHADLVRSFANMKSPATFLGVWEGNLQPLFRSSFTLDLVLLHSPNVRILKVFDETDYASLQHSLYDFGWLDLLVDAGQGMSVGLAPQFSHLKDLEINMAYGNLRLERLSLVFRLPSLTILTLTNVVEPDIISNWGCPPSTSSITTVMVDQAFMNSGVIAQLLCSCRVVKELTYGYDTTNWQPLNIAEPHKAAWAPHSWPIIYNALKAHKGSLKKLDLGYYVDDELLSAASVPSQVCGRLGSLQEFCMLEELRIPMHVLGDCHGSLHLASALSPTIRIMTIDGLADGGILKAYNEMLESGICPSLVVNYYAGEFVQHPGDMYEILSALDEKSQEKVKVVRDGRTYSVSELRGFAERFERVDHDEANGAEEGDEHEGAVE